MRGAEQQETTFGPLVEQPRRRERLGNCWLMERLQTGETAELWLGVERMGSLGDGRAPVFRPVVVKKLHRELALDPRFSAFFRREAERMLRLAHVHLAPVLRIGQEGPEVFVVAPFIEGESLAEVLAACLRNGAVIPEGQAAAIGADVALALGHLHADGLHGGQVPGAVHHDLSTRSVLVGYDGRVLLVDTGLGRGVPEERRGQAPAKARFRAPELRAGQGDHRADLFSLGAILWEGSTGRPFPHRLSDGERAHDLCTRSPELSRELRAVILRAVAQDPQRRWASAAELAQVLARIAHGAVDPRARERLMGLLFSGRRDEKRAAVRRVAREMAGTVERSLAPRSLAATVVRVQPRDRRPDPPARELAVTRTFLALPAQS